jgi:hypothetical protein
MDKLKKFRELKENQIKKIGNKHVRSLIIDMMSAEGGARIDIDQILEHKFFKKNLRRNEKVEKKSSSKKNKSKKKCPEKLEKIDENEEE